MASRYFTGAGEGPRVPHLAKSTTEVGDLRGDVDDGFQRVQDELDAAGVTTLPKSKFTEDGGFAVQLINKTGAASVRGAVVDASDTTDDAVKLVGANGFSPAGVFLDSGVADGDPAWVVVSGTAYVLLQDGTASTRGYWARTSVTTAGRADATNAAPPGGTIGALETHLKEIGHCLETKAPGTDVLAKCFLHFN